MHVIKATYQLLRRCTHKFSDDDGFTLSSSLAFYSILSVIPITLIAVSLIGHYLGQSESLFNQVLFWLAESFPKVQSESVDLLKSLVTKKISFGSVGILALFLVASFIFLELEHALNKVFLVPKIRSFWHSHLIALGLTIISSFILLLPSFVAFIMSMLQSFNIEIKYANLFHGPIFFYFAHFFLYVFAIKIIPPMRVSWKNVFIGALLFSTVSLIVRKIFQWYVIHNFERYSFLYGSLSLLFILILWIYYLAVVFIFSSELVSILEND